MFFNKMYLHCKKEADSIRTNVARHGKGRIRVFSRSCRSLCGYLAFVSLLMIGCQSDTNSTAVITGRLESNGKAVYPAVVMLKDGGTTGGGLSGNTDNDGVFKIYNVQKKNYQVAVEPIRLAGISQAERTASREPRLDQDGFPIREESIPDAFLNANIDFPEKYFKFETSGLNIDCSAGVPGEEVVLRLD